MNNWKRALVVSGVIGLVLLAVPFSGRSLLWDDLEGDPLAAFVHAAIFVLPLVMGALALARPPMRAWQSGVALAGCVLGVVRFHVWDLALHPATTGARGVVLAVAIVGGTAASVATLLRPEV